jgi:hypothetical protein
MKRLGPRWLLYATAFVIVAYLAGRWQSLASAADTAAVHDAETILAAGKAYRLRIAHLEALERQQFRTAQAWRARADSLRGLARMVETVELPPDSGVIRTWQQVADAEHQSASACFVSLTSCQERATTAEQRVASLDSSLTTLLRVKDCKILWVRCPSRMAMGLGGLGAGVVLGLVLSR